MEDNAPQLSDSELLEAYMKQGETVGLTVGAEAMCENQHMIIKSFKLSEKPGSC